IKIADRRDPVGPPVHRFPFRPLTRTIPHRRWMRRPCGVVSIEPPAGNGVPHMPGETDLHKTLKKEACRWLFRMGYRCIAAEVRLKPLGIIDAVGTGLFRAYANYLMVPREQQQVCFVDCKASRADFLRDQSNDGQMELCLMERKRNMKV